MLIQAIKFEIRNFATNSAEVFVVENTADNYSVIAMQKNTREIEFTEYIDFDFDRKYRAPKFLKFSNIVLNSFDNNSYDEIDEIDEMVGAF